MVDTEVLALLDSYKQNLARLAYLKCELYRLSDIVDSLRTTIIEDEVQITQKLSDMPHGTGLSDPTAQIAVKVADGYVPERIRQVERDIECIQAEMRTLDYKVRTVDALMQCLNPREDILVRRKYIDKMYWRDIVSEFARMFGEEYSKQGLKYMLSNGMDKIFEVAARPFTGVST